MSTVTPPRAGIPIGRLRIGDKVFEVEADGEYLRFFASMVTRVGGVTGTGTEELVVSQFEDAGIEECKAQLYAWRDEAAQGTEAALREEIALLRSRLAALEQRPERDGAITLAAAMGILPIANGGTGQSSQQAALNALTGAVTNNRVLRANGTNIVLAQVALTTDVTGVLPTSNGGTGTTTVAFPASGTLGSLSLAQSWTQTNTYTKSGDGTASAILLSANRPCVHWHEADGAADAKRWNVRVEAGSWRVRIQDDAETVDRDAIVVSRAGNAVTDVSVGNATDNPTFTAAGTGGIRHGSSTLLATTAALANGAAAAGGTLTNAPAAGNPTKWVPINDNGTTRYIPAW
ncbi:MAG: hypothetical protein KIH64_007145 [Mycobacterium sp.]|nr:hypothetical protein [Mycobacterium sp.]